MADSGAPTSASKAAEVVDSAPSESQTQEKTSTTALGNQPTEATSSHDPTTAPSSSTSEPSSSSPRLCTSCSKPFEIPKPCPRCHTTPYCSRECQKADYKKHKKQCAELAQKYATTADIKMATTRVPPKNERRGGLQKWQFDT